MALKPVDHQLLHAIELGFDHPVTGERIERSSSVPPDYAAVLEALRG
jgi:23S rRNA pseudouridine1911/1915/1917 synthase